MRIAVFSSYSIHHEPISTSVTHLEQAISLETYRYISRLIGSLAVYFFASGGKYIIALGKNV
jgi:hypothetical protein